MTAAWLGRFFLDAAFISSAIAFAFGTVAARRDDPDLHTATERASVWAMLFTTAAAAVLGWAFATGKWQFKVVYDYADKFLPIYYRIAAFYAGQTGSLLFWAFILSIYSAAYSLLSKSSSKAERSLATSICSAVLLFFLGLLVFVDDPFELLPTTPADGRGLNPILQNPAMLFHPPVLYIGYIGFTVPAAVVAARLYTGKGETMHGLRGWVLFSWLFLGLGNILGAWWAYVELGWGGFWGWDPVENASLMPWLLATALLHIMLSSARGRWFTKSGTVLTFAVFIFTILGTFITRSGLIESVHAYAQSPVGFYFLAFLFVLTAGGGIWLLLKQKNIPEGRPAKVLSREGMIAAFVVLTCISSIFILTGVLTPTLSEWLGPRKISVTKDFYAGGMAPVGVIMLILLASALVLNWNGVWNKKVKFSATITGAAFTACLAAAALFKFPPFVAGCTAAGAAALIAIIYDVIHQTKNSSVRRKLTAAGAAAVHLGVLMAFAGICGTYFKTEKIISLYKGKPLKSENMLFILKDVRMENLPDRAAVEADLIVKRGGRTFILSPRRERFFKFDQPVSEIAVRSRPLSDVYAILGDVDVSIGSASFKIVINPLVWFLWAGGAALFAGTILLWTGTVRRRSKEVKQ